MVTNFDVVDGRGCDFLAPITLRYSRPRTVGYGNDRGGFLRILSVYL